MPKVDISLVSRKLHTKLFTKLDSISYKYLTQAMTQTPE